MWLFERLCSLLSLHALTIFLRLLRRLIRKNRVLGRHQRGVTCHWINRLTTLVEKSFWNLRAVGDFLVLRDATII